MDSEKETYNSDTLEKSNLSSLQSDNPRDKASEVDSNVNANRNQNCVCNQHELDNVKFVPCPVLNFDPTQYFHPCPCQQYQVNENDVLKQTVHENRKNKCLHFNLKWPRQNLGNKKNKLNKSKSKYRSVRSDKSSTCKILEGINPHKYYRVKNVVENPIKHKLESEKDNPEKIEIYYFDHGNSAYYHTTDIAPILKTEEFAEKANTKLTKAFAELFGYFHLAASTFTTFVLQFLRFILFSLVRPLTVGVIQLVADYFIKPFLSITFNGLIQPFIILFYNMATSIRDCCEPLATALGFYVKEVAILIRSFRLIEISNKYRSNSET